MEGRHFQWIYNLVVLVHAARASWIDQQLLVVMNWKSNPSFSKLFELRWPFPWPNICWNAFRKRLHFATGSGAKEDPWRPWTYSCVFKCPHVSLLTRWFFVTQVCILRCHLQIALLFSILFCIQISLPNLWTCAMLLIKSHTFVICTLTIVLHSPTWSTYVCVCDQGIKQQKLDANTNSANKYQGSLAWLWNFHSAPRLPWTVV